MTRGLGGKVPPPVILKPAPDELLSSWIARHADFYGVSPLTMLRHAVPDAKSLRQADTELDLTAASRIATLFRAPPSTVLEMTLTGFPKSAARFVAARAIQFCAACVEQNGREGASTAVQRSCLEGWRITCPVCRYRLQEKREERSAPASRSSPFEGIRVDALHGERLIDQSLMGATIGWISPIDIARLLLIRRCPRPFHHKAWVKHSTVLGAVIPGFDELMAEQELPRPAIARPILPIEFRMALLAGISTVYQEGPTMGAYHTQFAAIATGMLVSSNSETLLLN